MLTRADLYSLETYAVERDAFRARVLAHKRPLALNMIRRLTQGLRIPTDTLISQCQEDVESA